MLMNLRNALMAGKRLPYDAEIEYLESTGTQWIDTGITPQLTGIHKLNFTPSVQSPVPWGCLNFTETSGYGRYFATSGQGLYPRLVGVNYLIEVDGISKKIIVNGNEETPLFSFTTSASGNCWLFGRSDTGVLGSLKIYSASSTDANGVLVRDFIPVRKGTVGYLYDRVSGRLFGNAGTGDFVLGPDVVPVEYIESHGTEWIDTGIKSLSAITDFDFEITARFLSVPSSGYVGSGFSSSSEAQMFYAINAHAITGLYMACNSTTNIASNLSADKTLWHSVKATSTGGTVRYYFDNVQVSSYTSSTFTLPFLYLFDISAPNGRSSSARGNQQISSFRFSANNTPLRSFCPVRVGSGSTWEGAMMDVLTRRIYRNAGTGAFGYGNDLKYPIPAE